MGFGTWIPLILFILVPIIIVLYMLKQRAQEYEFSSNLLWKEIYQNIEATKPWEKLKNNFLMILQIMAVLLMILILMSPYIKAHSSGEKNIILVLDCSASMSTLYDGNHTRLEMAKEKACDYVDNLGIGANMTIISSTNKGNLIITNSSDKTELKQTIQSLKQTSLPGDISNSISLIQSASSQWEDCDILIFTDTAFDTGKLEIGVVSLYTDVTNLSIDYISCNKNINDYTVLVRVTNHSDETQSREINLYSGEDLLDITQVVLLPNETKVVYFESVQPTASTLRAEFQETDDLKEDNVIFGTVEETNQNKVLLVTESNLFLEKALLNFADIELFRTNDLTQVLQSENSFDLYILDGVSCKESDLPVTGNLLLVNSTVEGITEDSTNITNRMLTFLDGDLTAYIRGDIFGVNEAISYTLPRWGTIFLSSYDDVVGFFGEYDGRKIVTLGFDLHKTDLGLQAQFPILMSNLMEYLLEHGIVSQTTYISGDSVLLNGSSKGKTLQIQKPDGTVHEMEVSLIANAYTHADELGIYLASQEIEDKVISQYFAINFPVISESDVLSVYTTIENGASNKEEVLIEGAIDLKNHILIILIGLLFFEWYIYIKRM